MRRVLFVEVACNGLLGMSCLQLIPPRSMILPECNSYIHRACHLIIRGLGCIRLCLCSVDLSNTQSLLTCEQSLRNDANPHLLKRYIVLIITSGPFSRPTMDSEGDRHGTTFKQ